METKELKIIPPEGYKIDKENSTLDCIKFKYKFLTYNDVIKNLFRDGKKCYFTDASGRIIDCDIYNDPNNATSRKQLEKLLAINKLMNVAKYLNGDWEPDWNDDNEPKWYISIEKKKLSFNCCWQEYSMDIYFKLRDYMLQAIDILGEDTIRLALSTDY